jgi:hypothetical protein
VLFHSNRHLSKGGKCCWLLDVRFAPFVDCLSLVLIDG